MALLLHNQAAFVEQMSRNNREWLDLKDRQNRTEAWQRETEQRLERIEESLVELPKTILKSVLDQLPKIITQDVLAKLPKAVKKEIGFKSPE